MDQKNLNNIFISTGEVSGDLITSHLIKELQALSPNIKITAIGGSKVADTGVNRIFDSTELGAIGIFECIPLLGKYIRFKKTAKRQLKTSRPDCAILIDANGFNSGLAKQLRKKNIPAICFIPSQDWVFNKLSPLMARLVECTQRIICIFPQAEEYYRGLGAKTIFLGNPLVDILDKVPLKKEARKILNLPQKAKVVALMPASRRQELHLILPEMLAAAKLIQKQYDNIYFCLPIVRHDLTTCIKRICEKAQIKNLSFFLDEGPNVIAASDVVVSKSGSVNIEAAIIGTPQVVFYKLNAITYWLAQNVLRMKNPPFISPVNLLAETEVVPEFLQNEVTPEALAYEVCAILSRPDRCREFQYAYKRIKKKLGQKGVIKNVAQDILNFISQYERKTT